MTYEVYRFVFLGCAVLAGVMLAATVLVFFLLKIPEAIAVLAASKSRKGVKRSNNSNKHASARTDNQERAMHKEKSNSTAYIEDRDETRKLYPGNDTKKSESSTETNEGNTYTASDILAEVYNNQDDSEEETTVKNAKSRNVFVIECEITFIHTDEEIT